MRDPFSLYVARRSAFVYGDQDMVTIDNTRYSVHDASLGRVREPELTIDNNSTVFVNSISAAEPLEPLERPEVELRKAIARCLKEGVPEDRMQEIWDESLTRYVMES